MEVGALIVAAGMSSRMVVLFVCIMDRQNNQNSRYHIH